MMDTLAVVTVALAGLCSYVFVTMRMKATFALVLFSWLFAIPWLLIYSIIGLWSLQAIDLMQWSTGAEMGPVTLILAVVGLCLLTAGGKRDATRV